MEEQERAESASALPIILIAAVLQGWALYGLYFAIAYKHWPATDASWLTALHSIALLIPATVQLLADHMRKPAAMGMVAAMAVVLFYMGWHGGVSLAVIVSEQRNDFEELVPFAFELIVLWLLALPFLQARLIGGSWQLQYETLFATAWRNKLALAEAAAFTGALWLLLLLWQSLFGMLGIRFFSTLFREPLFIYPVTSITFGLALHLIGSVERFTSIVLEQVLNVLKWLAVVAGLILAMFTITLLFKLPGLFSTGERIISAAWLLWLVAVIVLLVNAAYRDGTVERPYPRWIAFALRIVVPLAAVIALTAMYALYVRTTRYGLTVERVWAFVVAGAAMVYSIGYGIAASRGGRWMGGISQVNIVAALALIAVIALALTPILSPYRLAANSQAKIAAAAGEADQSRFDSALVTLRFDTGNYGQEKLGELAKIKDRPDAEKIRAAVAAIQLKPNRWGVVGPSRQMLETSLASLPLYPAGAILDPALQQQVIDRLRDPTRPRTAMRNDAMAGTFVDLDGDGLTEFVLIDNARADLFERSGERWRFAGSMSNHRLTTNNDRITSRLADDLRAGPVEARPPRWKNLIVGKREYRVDGFER